MTKERLSRYLAAIVILAGIVCFILPGVLGDQVAPLTIQFAARIGGWEDESPFPPGAKFLVKNNTQKTLIVTLDKIEVRTGSVWAVHSVLARRSFTLGDRKSVV